MTVEQELYPPIAAYRHGQLAVGGGHAVYWEEAGSPAGLPVLVLHGGPGAGSSPQWRRFFDPARYRIVQFDQRGSGQSTPAGEWRHNRLPDLIADIEAVRALLGIERWLVHGGSWGATLALAYAQAHPQRCSGLLLRAIFLGSAAEIDWFFEGARRYHPELYAAFVSCFAAHERADLLGASVRALLADDGRDILPLARAWTALECERASLYGPAPALPDSLAFALARIEAWYFSQRCFLAPDALLQGAARLRGIPALIVHGRQDMLCQPLVAFQLAGHYPGARLRIVEMAGHTAFDPPMRTALLRATDAFWRSGHFDEACA
ncbi:prolyl aminopeptidase [Massilia sp. TS11]|uniref:prolyl aminopeptidase n=1 Tax=Massilia sp. TS11 TaxID=2908003 RepID=UPI001EDB5D43|nr:prolyl aminopeptidase [Massilia sp. TS11]MCG2583429.1 prolyl aminopeptidase [Massilia sp. TS11]